MNPKKVSNPLEAEVIAWFNKSGMYVAGFLAALLGLALIVFIAWNLALPPLGVRALSYPQAIGFTLFLALVAGLVMLFKDSKTE